VFNVAACLDVQATIVRYRGDVRASRELFAQALQAASEALEIDLRGKNATSIAVSHINIAAYHLALGDFTAARDSAREGLRVARQVRHEQVIATALQHLVLLAGLGGDARRAAQLLGHVDAQYATLGMQREPTEQWGYDKLMATLREQLSDADIEKLAADGAAWSEDRAVEEALKVSPALARPPHAERL
jgi:hypothetical protein